MTQIALTRMSSKGQIVIPRELREGIEEGEQIVVVKSGKHILLQKAEDFDEKLTEDIDFAKRTEAALKKYEKGEFIEMDFDKFIEEAKKW